MNMTDKEKRDKATTALLEFVERASKRDATPAETHCLAAVASVLFDYMNYSERRSVNGKD